MSQKTINYLFRIMSKKHKNIFLAKHPGSAIQSSLRAVCHGIKKRMRKESDPEKKRMWAEIGLELNNLLMQLE